MQKKDEELIRMTVEELVKGVDGFIVELRITAKKIFIMIDKMTGLNIDDCATVSRGLHDAELLSSLLEAYEVEVSSPGADQPFKVYQQYQKYMGWQVSVKTLDGTEKKGQLDEVKEKEIVLKDKRMEKVNKKKQEVEEVMNISFDDIKETKLILTTKK